MRFSVILPCHNAARWIAQALRSVAGQTHRPHEIIVIDDSSTDDSMGEVRRSGVAVRILTSSARNAAATRNIGIEAATGDWIALLDSDDVWYPTHLARAAEILENSVDVAFMANHDWIDLHGNQIAIPIGFQCQLPAPALALSSHDFFDIMRSGFHFGHSTVIYNRARVLEVGKFDVSQRRRHDIDLWLRVIADRSWSYDVMKAAGYRENTPGSISKNELECDYYYLRALTRNLPRSASPLFHEYLRHQSRRALGIAFVEGLDDHYRRIRELAMPHLSMGMRMFYGFGERFPVLTRRAMRTKRLVVNCARAHVLITWGLTL